MDRRVILTGAPATAAPVSGDVVLATHGLVKRFGQLTAVDRLDIEVRRGEVVGLLGPNGAGKSTTIGMILGLVVPTSGRAEVMGRDVWHGRQNALAGAGAIVETPAFYPYLSGRDNLRALALIRGSDAHTRVDPLLGRLGLGPRAGSKYRTYSLGMKQRLGIASTLLSDPALVILDEPANGLDPAGQREIRELVRELATEGHGVLLASHVLHEVEQICDRVLVINRGRLIASGTIAEVTHGASYFDVEVAEPARAGAVLRAIPGVAEVRESDGRLRVVFDATRGADLSRALAGAGLYPSALIPRKSSLEDVFLELTDEGGAGAAAPS